MTYRLSGMMFAALSVVSATVYASDAPRVLVAPTCLTQAVSVPFTTLATDKSLVLIQVDANVVPAFADTKHEAKTVCGGFMDVTDEWKAYAPSRVAVAKKGKAFLATYHMDKAARLEASNYQIRYPTQTNKLMSVMDANRMWSDLTTLTNFKNRNANSDLGVKAADWIKQQVLDMAKTYGRDDVSIRYVATPGYKQPSIVAKIGTSNEPGIVIGAHMDTTSFTSDRQPGADDDGSGSVTVLEVTRTILSSDVRFKKPIYVMWYAAEEAGLVGSKYVVQDFKAKNIPVSEVLHLDMTGFPDSQNPSAIWLISDYVNKDLTGYLKTLIETYLKQPVEMTACGYACSDHASWTKGGFKSAMPSESSFERSNHAIHSERDTMDKLSLRHMSDYAKLGIAFAVELAEPVA